MKILYSEKVDREIHDEVNTKGKDLAAVFGFDFHRVSFDDKKADEAKNIDAAVDMEKAGGIMRDIFKVHPPQITLYFNTTPFSTWNTKEKYVCISVQRYPDKIFSSVCHELNHYMYDTVFGTEKYEETERKETFTVLNEFYDVKDYGWKVFKEKRDRVLDAFGKGEDVVHLRMRIL